MTSAPQGGTRPTVVSFGSTVEKQSKQAVVFRALGRLAEIVAPEGWCLIGGLMVEVLLRSRGVDMVRPTDDGDIIGDVVANRRVLRMMAAALEGFGFEHHPTGWDLDISVRFVDRSTGAYIDLLQPANTSKLRNVAPPARGRRTLLAPGSDFALSTATVFDIEFDDEPTIRVQIPSVAGAIYAKASAAKELDPKDRPLKHLHDAAQLLGVVRLDELVGHGPAMGRRLRWLLSALGSTDSPGWQYVPLAKRSDAALRLTVAAADY